MFTVDDVLDLVQEQHIDLGGVADDAQVGAVVNQLGNGKNPVVGANLDIVQQLLGPHDVKLGHMQMTHASLQGTDGLEQGFLDGAAHGHNLAGGLHLGGQGVGGVGELVKGEPGHLGDHIVQGRLEAGGGVGQLNLVQVHTHGDFGGDPSDGVAAGLGSQSRGTGHAGVDLDEVIAEGSRVQGKLDVAAALDFQGANQLQRAVTEQVVFLVGQRLAGGHHDGVAGVDAHGVDVLHITDGDGRVVGVADDLILDFLVTLDAFFHQDLMDGRQGQGVFQDFAAFLFVVGKAAAGAAQGKGGTQHHGVADFLGGFQALVHGIGDDGGQDRLAQLLAQLLEQFPVLGLADGVAGSTQHFHATLLENAHLFQFHGQVQTRLAADAGNQGVGPLHPDNAGGVLRRQGFHIDLVGNGGVGHDGGRVGVGQQNLIALLFQGKARLGAGVVELGGLSDDDGAGADDHDFANVCSLRHWACPPSS